MFRKFGKLADAGPITHSSYHSIILSFYNSIILSFYHFLTKLVLRQTCNPHYGSFYGIVPGIFYKI
jgi:hypothetical protein